MAAPTGTAPTDDSPLARLLRVLGGPWTLLILCVLHLDGPTRFGGLRRRLGSVSTKVLTERLRLLEAEGLVYRHYEPTVPPAVTYGLTDRMAELAPVLKQLNRVGERWYGPARRCLSGRPNGAD